MDCRWFYQYFEGPGIRAGGLNRVTCLNRTALGSVLSRILTDILKNWVTEWLEQQSAGSVDSSPSLNVGNKLCNDAATTPITKPLPQFIKTEARTQKIPANFQFPVAVKCAAVQQSAWHSQNAWHSQRNNRICCLEFRTQNFIHFYQEISQSQAAISWRS